jgi:CRISPR-associated protein Cas5d
VIYLLENSFEFELKGQNALFTNPLTKVEKQSYLVPTYQSLVGVASSVYWKPTFIISIDQVRVINPIDLESKSIRPLDKNFSLNKNSLAYYTYIHLPIYQVKGHIEWNMQREDLKQDRNIKKHMAIFNRALKAGGRRDIFLGTRECQGYVRPMKFGTGKGAYDDVEHRDFGMMFHGYNYPDETGVNEFSVRLWNAHMDNGIITFPSPEECKTVQKIRDVQMQPYDWPQLSQSVDDLYAETNGGE